MQSNISFSYTNITHLARDKMQYILFNSSLNAIMLLVFVPPKYLGVTT